MFASAAFRSRSVITAFSRGSGIRRRCQFVAAPFSDASASSEQPERPTPTAVKNAFRAKLASMREQSLLGGGEARIEKQHKGGKLTARERLDLLFDDDTFREFDRMVVHDCDHFGMSDHRYLGDGVVAGRGLVAGRPCYAFSQVGCRVVVAFVRCSWYRRWLGTLLTRG